MSLYFPVLLFIKLIFPAERLKRNRTNRGFFQMKRSLKKTRPFYRAGAVKTTHKKQAN